MLLNSLIVLKFFFGFSLWFWIDSVTLRGADLVTLKGGVGATQHKCWAKDLGSIQWNPHCAAF